MRSCLLLVLVAVFAQLQVVFTAGHSTCGQTPITPDLSPVWNEVRDRQLSGHIAKPYSWPWEAVLCKHLPGRALCSEHICSATIIAERWALTTAACANETSAIYILKAGVFNLSNGLDRGQQVRVDAWHIHPQYDGQRFDLALLELRFPLQFVDEVQPLCLDGDNDVLRAGEEMWSAGWGEIRNSPVVPEGLRQTAMAVLDHDECTRWFPWAANYENEVVCADAPTCWAGIGSPLTHSAHDTWFASAIATRSTTENCESPSLFMRVSSICDWLEETTELPLCSARGRRQNPRFRRYFV